MNYLNLLRNLYQPKQNAGKAEEIKKLQEKVEKVALYAYDHLRSITTNAEAEITRSRFRHWPPLPSFPALDKQQLWEHLTSWLRFLM